MVGYIISYLLKAGAQGIAAVGLVKKSRSKLAAERKAKKELGVSRRTDMILAAKKSQDMFQTKQMSYQMELKAIATSHRYYVDSACHIVIDFCNLTPAASSSSSTLSVLKDVLPKSEYINAVGKTKTIRKSIRRREGIPSLRSSHSLSRTEAIKSKLSRLRKN